MIETQLGIIRTQRTLEMFTTSYDYLVYVIPYLVVAPLYFSNKLQLGSITQASEAFFYVRSDFSIIVNYFEKISAFSAGIDRLSTFIHRINEGGWNSAGTNIDDMSGEILKPKGTLTELTRSLAGSPEGYSKVSDGDDNDDITKLKPNAKKRKSTIELLTGTLNDSGKVHGELGSDRDESSRIILQCENLSVLTPDGYRTLIGGVLGSTSGIVNDNNSEKEQKGVNFRIYKGDRVLVVGSSGTGKSSLLRAISGLWELGSGKITWNSGLNDSHIAAGDSRAETAVAPQGVFFLPQKPYNLLGSLRQQIAYPDIFPGDEEESSVRHLAQQKNTRRKDRLHIESGSTAPLSLDGDAEILEILRKVRLDTLASRMGSGDVQRGLAEHKDWTKVLSLGEQQRLAFARVLYNRKSISVVVLDEATSALDEPAESAMYSLLGELDITYISVGHRPSLYAYHTQRLGLNGPGCEVEYTPITSTQQQVKVTY